MKSIVRIVQISIISLALSACAVMDTLLATSTPTPLTPTPTQTPTVVWFPASPIPTQGPQATPRPPTPEMRPGIGELTLLDDFSDPKLWETHLSDSASAMVRDNRIVLSAQPGVYIMSLRFKLSLTDGYLEITARPDQCQGEDSYGVLVRANANSYYRLSLTCSGSVMAERLSVGRREVLQMPLISGDVPRGAPGQVRIGVWAVGPEIRLFLNGRHQFSFRNNKHPNGTIGVFLKSAANAPALVSFSDLRLQSVNYLLPTRTPQP